MEHPQNDQIRELMERANHYLNDGDINEFKKTIRITYRLVNSIGDSDEDKSSSDIDKPEIFIG